MNQAGVARWVAEERMEQAHAVIRKKHTVAATCSGFLSGNLSQGADDDYPGCSVARWASMQAWKAWKN